jgi:dCMP deaminase
MKISEKWDRKYLELAKYVANSWSHDPSTKVGAVLVNYEYGQEFIGYNGFPSGVKDLDERYANRELKYKLIVHAEINAISKAGLLAKGSTLYVYPTFSLPPICHDCCKLAIQHQIKEVVGYYADPKSDVAKRWEESYNISKMMLEEAGITWRGLKEL